MYEEVKVTGAVSTVLVVFEIKPEPSVDSAIQNVECPGLRGWGSGYKQQDCHREFQPTNGLRSLGDFDKAAHCFFQGTARWNCEDWFRFHVAEHNCASFLEGFSLRLIPTKGEAEATYASAKRFDQSTLAGNCWHVGEFSAGDSQNGSADVREGATMSSNHGQFPRIHETSGKQDC